MQVTAIASAVALALGALAGGAYTGHERDAEIARLERDHALQLVAAADAASVRLYQAQQRSDALTTDLHAAIRAARQLQKGLDDAIARTTDGRACLREPALRVLDDAPGIRVTGLSKASGGAVGAHAGVVTTDTDIARWAASAGQQYDECRRRLDALIDWHETKERP